MASSDDEGEMVPENASDYEFFLCNKEPVSFTQLPIQWDEGLTRNEKLEIFLSGKTDNGLLRVYKQVVAWKFDLSLDNLEISVFSADNYWIKLEKPRKAYQDIIRTIQIALHFLHFVRHNPQLSWKAVWDYLNKTFSMFERRPSEDDLMDHMALIEEAYKRDEALGSSKLLRSFLGEKPRRRKNINEDFNPPFIVDDTNGEDDLEEFHMIDENGGDESDEDDCFDSVCAICDNGGHIYICDGKCLRSFHATIEDGEESNCESLGFTEVELEAYRNKPFYCKNCEYKQHQCFACGELGSSDETSSVEVFCCVNGACGLFYHARCVAKLLHCEDKTTAEEREKKIAAGEQFACPAHRCHVCNELEVRSNRDLQFAVCRRCPRVYHRKCLPREIAFEEDVEDGEIEQRAWEGLIPNRILIYCLKHEIDPEIATPARDHIKFPGHLYEKKNLSLDSSKKKDLKKERVALEDKVVKRTAEKSVVMESSSLMRGEPTKKRVGKFPLQEPVKKRKLETNKSFSGKPKESKIDRGELSLGEKLYDTFYGMTSEVERPNKGPSVQGEQEGTQKVKPVANKINDYTILDADSRKRILTLMKDASSLITLDQIKERHKAPLTHSQYSKFYADNITMGKVEGIVKAVRAALKKLDEGGNVQDAKAVCGKDLLIQVLKWREKYKVYLAPFLYGMRYTSFGRHFTKRNKLVEVVDILHWYIQDGDMLVDFCCGSNDFSCLAKTKLDETGKKCSFKNYDILQPKNDFCFEKRDWMKVRRNELPNGSQLIMGLNPPFGVNASLANQFINKALEFKPKLIILIVPRETKRLDGKECAYDLIGEDDQMFVGKSFYLPGSVDVNDKQIEDWNVKQPLLYLWSRRDWTVKHKAIAEKHGHFSRSQKKDISQNEAVVHNSPQECQKPEESPVEKGQHSRTGKNPETHGQKGKVTESQEEALSHDDSGAKGDKIVAKGDKTLTHAQGKNHVEPRSGGKKRMKNRRKNNAKEESSYPRHSSVSTSHPSPNMLGRDSPKLNDSIPQLSAGRDGGYQHPQQHVINQRPFATSYPHRSEIGYNKSPVRLYSLNSEERMTSSRQAYTQLTTEPGYSFRASAATATDQWMMMGPEGRSNSGFPYRPYDDSGERNLIRRYGRTMEPHSWDQTSGLPNSSFLGHTWLPSPAVDSRQYGLHTGSAMQRYASRLGLEDPFNHSPMVPRPSAPSMYHHQVGSLGFASAPRSPVPRPGPFPPSSGWLND